MADAGAPPAGSVHTIATGDGHALHVESLGRREGTPFLFLHGGPGSGCQPGQRALFDPDRHFVLFADQRGAGRSTPHGARTANTTPHLVADIERVRQHFGITRWGLVGGSWGATLALAYAAAYPERVTSLVLRATFLGTRVELEQAFVTGLSTRYPALYADFLSLLTEAERRQPLDSYWARILDPDPAIHLPAAIAWHDVERILSVANLESARLDFARVHDAAQKRPSTPFMEAHYFAHDCFLAPGELMAQIPRLAPIPAIFVHGEHDHLCSLPIVRRLVAQWPRAQLRVVAGAGHSLGEPGVEPAVRTAIAEVTSDAT